MHTGQPATRGEVYVRVSLPPRRTGVLPGVPTVGRVARVDYAHLAVALDAVVTRQRNPFWR